LTPGDRNEFWLNINNNVFGHDPNDAPGTTEAGGDGLGYRGARRPRAR